MKFRFRLLLLLLPLLLLLGWLVAGPKPWDPGLDTSPEAKEAIRTHGFVVRGLWWGALAGVILLSGRFLLARIFPYRERAADSAPGVFPAPNLHRQEKLGLRLGILAAGLASAWMMAPRLSLSLWGDEEATVLRFVVGRYYPAKDGTMAPKKPSWIKTLWNFDNGANNHPLNSALARLSAGLKKPSTAADQFPFSETLIRLPAYLAGVGSIFTVGWLAWMMGLPRAAPLASWLMALHPWIIRWGSEARGYAFELAFIGLTMGAVLAALATGKFRWWVVFGAAEVLLLISHFGSVMFLLPLNASILVILWQRSGGRPLRSAEAWSWINASVGAAVLTLLLLGPAVEPMRRWLASEKALGRGVTPGWFIDWLSYFGSGTPWYEWEPENPFSVTLRESLVAHPLTSWPSLILLLVGFATGVAFLARHHSSRWWLLPLLMPVPLTCLQSVLKGTLLYPWYAVGFLPPFLIVISVGWCFAMDQWIPPRWTGWWRLLIGVIPLGVFALQTSGQRQRYQDHSVEPLAESVRTYRKTVNAGDLGLQEVVSIGVMHYTRLYDPATIEVRDAAEILSILKQADADGKPVVVNAANLGLAEQAFGPMMALLHDRRLFSEPEIHPGLQPVCTRYIWRHFPPSHQP